MTVIELLENIKNKEEYISNSLYLKSSDNFGCVYKYLKRQRNPIYAERVEIFIELNEEEGELQLLDKNVVSYIEIYPAN